jgi:hypothetical protein
MFKGVPQCMPTVGVLCFTLVCSTPSITLPYPFTYHPRFSTVLNTHPYILYLHILCYVILLMLYHSLFLFPRVSQNSSTVTNMFYIWFFIWPWLFLCICLSLDRSSMYETKHAAFVFWSWLISLNMMSSNCIHLLSNPMSLFHMAD